MVRVSVKRQHISMVKLWMCVWRVKIQIRMFPELSFREDWIFWDVTNFNNILQNIDSSFVSFDRQTFMEYLLKL